MPHINMHKRTRTTSMMSIFFSSFSFFCQLMCGNDVRQRTNSKEKEERLRLAQERKAEQEKTLETDMTARANQWLKGISRDLAKLSECQSSVAKAKDKSVRNTWTEEF